MILDDIVEHKKIEVEKLKKEKHSLKKKLSNKEMSLIAEIKKASPSRGVISDKFNPQLQFEEYRKGGAEALSILTDKKFFQGSNNILSDIRPQTQMPILRKDFIISPLQVYESLFLGADVILLIVAILSYEKLEELLKLARKLGMEAIVEVHSRKELEIAVNSSAEIIGINNRNLKDFSVNLCTTGKLINQLKDKNIREDYYIIAESGVQNRKDILYLSNLGVDGVLIGSSLMESEKTSEYIKELFDGIKED